MAHHARVNIGMSHYSRSAPKSDRMSNARYATPMAKRSFMRAL